MESGAGMELSSSTLVQETFVNTAEWPRPSKGCLKEQRHAGPGGEKLDRLGNLTVKVSTEQHGGNDILS